MKTRRIAAALLALLLLAMTCIAAGEETETEDYASVTYLNLDKAGKKQYYKNVKPILAKYPNLKKVDMYTVEVTRLQIEELVKLYPDVEFGWTMKLGDGHLVRTDATAFSTLHFSGAKVHGTKELSMLRYCKNLKALDIGHNAVDDLTWLTELPDLRVLIVAINRLTDITPLASLKKLEYLELFNNQITDISPLKGLTHLMDLNIGFNRIADFSPLYELKGLQRLWIHKAENRNGKENGISQKNIDALTKNLPNCRINYTSMPSLGGWREHPHYDVIKEMFQGSEYIPFSDSFEDDGVDQEPAPGR